MGDANGSPAAVMGNLRERVEARERRNTGTVAGYIWEGQMNDQRCDTRHTSWGSSTRAFTKPWHLRSRASTASGVATLAMTTKPFFSRPRINGRASGVSPPRTTVTR